MKKTVLKWGVFEEEFTGAADGNPFLEIRFSAVFKGPYSQYEAEGFYAGNGRYRIRLMPTEEGGWEFVTKSNCPELDGHSGSFTCVGCDGNNHGIVRVKDQYHFAYEDGTRYNPVGTTCYAWMYQSQELQDQTVATLADHKFNKLRMCLLPKYMVYNLKDPEIWPFQRNEQGGLDYTRVNPKWFDRVERNIVRLAELGIEADIILFHPYDKPDWGFSRMDADADNAYLKYAVSRLSHYHNVWWSVANEYDFLIKRLPISEIQDTKNLEDFDRFFRIIQRYDPYHHLRSIHNGWVMYDHGKPWVTHCSIQSHQVDHVPQWRDSFKKPVLVDECNYEGNINWGWGNISPEEMVRRFWTCDVLGGYATHGETYCHPKDILWWAHGGELHGESPTRIGFLRDILDEYPEYALSPVDYRFDVQCGSDGNRYYLFYFGIQRPSFYDFHMDGGLSYRVEIIDTWEMTVARLPGVYRESFNIELPGKPYMAVRMVGSYEEEL